jgi:hypothetical protein
MGHELIETGRGDTQVTHEEHHEREAGFDSTRFASREDFRTLLSRLDLPDEPAIEQEKVGGTPVGNRYVWANDHLLLVTGDNPFNLGSPTETRNGVWAGRIGLEGQEEAVEEAIVAIEQSRDLLDGDFNATRREYI